MSGVTIPEALAICLYCENELAAGGLLCATCRVGVEQNREAWLLAASSAARVLASDDEVRRVRKATRAPAEAERAESRFTPPSHRPGGIARVLLFLLFFEGWAIAIAWCVRFIWLHLH